MRCTWTRSEVDYWVGVGVRSSPHTHLPALDVGRATVVVKLKLTFHRPAMTYCNTMHLVGTICPLLNNVQSDRWAGDKFSQWSKKIFRQGTWSKFNILICIMWGQSKPMTKDTHLMHSLLFNIITFYKFEAWAKNCYSVMMVMTQNKLLQL